MCDKIQLNKDAYETSLFHHGLVKLLVLDSLQKIVKTGIHLYLSPVSQAKQASLHYL